MVDIGDIERTREIWFDGRAVPSGHYELWSLINNSPVSKILLTAEQRRNGKFPLRTEFITEIDNEQDLNLASPGEIVMSSDRSLLEAARRAGLKTCVFFQVEGREALEKSWQEASGYDYAIVDFDLPTNIPLELIIARLQGSSTVLLKRVGTLEEMEVVFGVMEKGSDGVLICTQDIQEISKVGAYLSDAGAGSLKLQHLLVEAVGHVGMGLRACIDTTGMMTRDEGMIIGSTSAGGIFVCSETHYLPYMNLRPFRVNAGAVHSYVWMPGNNAQYLTDLSAGSKVLCVDTCGKTRILTVGRVKIEARPLLLIKGQAAGAEINVIVQDDWHIRIMGADLKPRNASEIKPGDSLLAYVCDPGRHVGIKVNETILER
jgi:3-dehydroquinate synthase II/3-amino-4-hydroxybenzoic acid synthase